MSLPKQLVKSFEEIKSSPLVVGDISKDTVRIFVDNLNRAIPPSSNSISYTIYRFNRSLYIADKPKFLDYIKGFESYQSMILWTDFKDILDFFNLTSKVFLGWDKINRQYRAYIRSALPPRIRILRRGENINDIDSRELPPLHCSTPTLYKLPPPHCSTPTLYKLPPPHCSTPTLYKLPPLHCPTPTLLADKPENGNDRKNNTPKLLIDTSENGNDRKNNTPKLLIDTSVEDAMDDEMDRVYHYMRNRIAAIQNSLVNVD